MMSTSTILFIAVAFWGTLSVIGLMVWGSFALVDRHVIRWLERNKTAMEALDKAME